MSDLQTLGLALALVIASLGFSATAYVLASRRQTKRRLARFPKAGNVIGRYGVVVSDGILNEGVLPKQSPASEVLAAWCRKSGGRVRFVDPIKPYRGNPDWLVVCPMISEFEEILSGSQLAEETVITTRQNLINRARGNGPTRIGLVSFYDPFSTDNIKHDLFDQASTRLQHLNSRLKQLQQDNAGVDLIAIDEVLTNRAAEFTHVGGGRFALNWLGHGVLAALIERWIEGGSLRTTPESLWTDHETPESLLRYAQGIRA